MSQIVSRLHTYLVSKNISTRKLEIAIGASNGSMSRAIKNGTDIQTKWISIILDTYSDLNPSWLVAGEGDMVRGVNQSVTHRGDLNLVNEPKSTYSKKNVHSEFPQPEPIVITVDTSDHDVIPITGIKAAAGSGYINTEDLSPEDVIRLPNHMIKAGKHLCVRIKGNSMTPTLQDGGYVVVRLIERSEWQFIPEKHIFVVTDMDGTAYLKRVKNRFKQGFIVLSSDNPDKPTYPNFNLQEDEISSIWHVEWYLSAKMPNVHDTFYGEVSALRDGFDQLTQEFATMRRKISGENTKDKD